MSKLVEQLMQHINSTNLDNPRQYAYKSCHSTETALLHIKLEIYLSLSQCKPTTLVLLDMSAAFHTSLFNCLSHGLVCSIRP